MPNNYPQIRILLPLNTTVSVSRVNADGTRALPYYGPALGIVHQLDWLGQDEQASPDYGYDIYRSVLCSRGEETRLQRLTIGEATMQAGESRVYVVDMRDVWQDPETTTLPGDGPQPSTPPSIEPGPSTESAKLESFTRPLPTPASIIDAINAIQAQLDRIRQSIVP